MKDRRSAKCIKNTQPHKGEDMVEETLGQKCLHWSRERLGKGQAIFQRVGDTYVELWEIISSPAAEDGIWNTEKAFPKGQNMKWQDVFK